MATRAEREALAVELKRYRGVVAAGATGAGLARPRARAHQAMAAGLLFRHASPQGWK